ncbi:MAG TPA: TolC family protein [Thermoanaerobaculaceae bacterium]|nr:TolC family protein [Thermoanaerobaculaceae bacterium]
MLPSSYSRRRRSWRRAGAGVALGLGLGWLTACASVGPRGLTAAAPVPDSPARPVELPPPPSPTPTPAPAIPADLLKPGAAFSLAQVADVALANNPVSRTTWLQARSASAALTSKKGAYYPSLDLTAGASRMRAIAPGLVPYDETTYGPGIDLNYLLFDFGGRSGSVEEARQALLAADYAHNSAIQGVMLGVEQTYFAYLGTKAQLAAARETVKAAQVSLDAAKVRHDAGVATIADVLQAQTALSQAQLNQESLDGGLLAVRGSLATAMGLPASLPFDVGTLPAEVPLERARVEVANLIAEAQVQRPDLAALRAQAEKAAAHVGTVRAAELPSLSLAANANRTHYALTGSSSTIDSWSAGVFLTYPLFYGFSKAANLQQAKEDAAAATAQADTFSQQVVLQVWTSYYALETAKQRVSTSRDLLASAEQSERVALGRYKEGVGTILDLLTAQTALASARAQEIQARTDWLTAVAQLAHDAGTAATLGDLKVVTEQMREP